VSPVLISIWREATLRPRTGLPRLVRQDPHLVTLAFPAAYGVLQSFVQGVNNNVGARSALLTVLGMAIPIGAAWGLLQVHLAALALWVVARDGADRIPFARVRNVVALSSAPSAYALLAWLVAALFVGRALFIDPNVLPVESLSGSTWLRLTILYLGTMACVLWSAVLLVLGVKEIEGTTVRGAISTVLLSLFVIFAAALVLAIVAFIGVAILRSQPGAV